MRCNPSRWLWGLIPIAMLSWGTYYRERPHVEADLTVRATEALSKAGYSWAKVTLTGRDAVITGRAMKDGEPKAALDTVRAVWGIRTVQLKTDLAGVAAAPERIGPQAPTADEAAALKAKDAADAEAARKAQEEADAAAAALKAKEEAEAAALKAEEEASAQRAREQTEAAIKAQQEAEAALKAQEEADAALKAGDDAEAAAAQRAREQTEEAIRAQQEAEAALQAQEEEAAAQRAKEDAEAADALKAQQEAEAAAQRAREDAEAAARKAEEDAARKAQEEAEAAAAQKAKDEAEAAARAEQEAQARKAAEEAAQRKTTEETKACEKRLADAAAEGVILFSRASADIDAKSSSTIAKLADIIKQCPGARVEVEGHTDSEGTDERNQRLSERRALAVVNSLVHAGVAADRITSVGYGASRPVGSNDTPEGMAQNRRIEFKVFTD